VEFSSAAPKPSLKDALLFVSAGAADLNLGTEDIHARNLHVVHEQDLCERFGLVAA
jgi:hypothetical protein